MFGWLKRLAGSKKKPVAGPQLEMSYKEFNKWANERAGDGCWGPTTAMACAHVCFEINMMPRKKREIYWREVHARDMIEGLVKPTNRLIKERTGVEIKPI